VKKPRIVALAAFLSAAGLLFAADVPRLEYGLGLSLGMPTGLSILSDARLRFENGFVLGLKAEIPTTSAALVFPRNDEADGARTSDFRALDLQWGLYSGFVLGRSRAWETTFGLSFGGLVTYRSCRYEDYIVGIDEDYSKWTWIKEPRIFAAASISIGDLFGFPPLDGLRAGLGASLPLRGIWYIYSRWAAGLDISWRWSR
jgi:hypothetical protein